MHFFFFFCKIQKDIFHNNSPNSSMIFVTKNNQFEENFMVFKSTKSLIQISKI